jgi:tetratricopeptide (TPR) repeat protein
MTCPNHTGRTTGQRMLLFIFLATAPWAMTSPACGAEPGLKSATPGVDIFEVIESARKTLLADNYAEAARLVDEALKMPELVELDSTVQFQVFLIGAYADSGREDFLGAHEFMTLATEFPDAKAEHWFMRAQYASWVDAWPDALLAVTTIAKRWPDALTTANALLVSRIAYRTREDHRHEAELLELLNALFAARFTLEWGTQPDGLWRDLIVDALEKNDLRRAREISRRLQSPSTLLHLRTDRRFDALVKAEPRMFDVSAAVERECKRLAKATAANPRSLSVRVQYGYALLEAGRFAELLKMADEVIARATTAPEGSPPYDDIVDELNWIYNHKAASLRALGRWDEALGVMVAGRQAPEKGSVNVSQAINLGSHYVDHARPRDALGAIDGIDWAHSLSPYGRMQLQHVRYRAYLQLGDARQADDVFAYLREHREDAEDTWQAALLDSGDFDGAAALLIERLRDAEQRAQALVEMQEYRPLPQLPKQAEDAARREKLLRRADVAAAIDEVGRREKAPMYDVPD